MVLCLLLACVACAELPMPDCPAVPIPGGLISLDATTGEVSEDLEIRRGSPPCTIGSCPPTGAPCHRNICTATWGCIIVDIGDGGPCDDGDECTGPDICINGICYGLPRNCTDNNPCTSDSCELGVCNYNVLAGMSCNDGNKCTFNDGCTAKGCVGTPNLCDDGKACTIDLCKSEQGCVTWVNDAACEDYEPCTKDFCLEGSGCHHTPVPGPCKDGNLCTETACVGGKCTVVKLLCTCKVDSDCIGQSKLGLCQLPHCVNDKCEAQPGPQGQLCDDGVACTHPDVCFDGACGGTPDDKLCDDGIQCTKDLCKPPAGCVHIPDDGRCDDKNPCSKDYCDVLKGCLANKHPDGTACNVNGFCQQGVCQ